MSLISSIGNLVKPITQRLTGKSPSTPAPKPGATAPPPQPVEDDTDVAGEVQSLLAANPPTWQWILSAFVILAAGTAASYGIWKWVKPADFMPSSNYASYAGLFIMALAIERILEPFSGLFVPTTKQKKAQSRATMARAKRAQTAATLNGAHAAATVPVVPARTAAGVQQAVAARQAAVAQQTTVARKVSAAAQKEAALAQTSFHRAQGARAVLMWATASVLAMLVCAALGVFLLRSVETPAPAQTSAASSATTPAKGPNRVLDLLVTGLVVGAGTKPLHDLITQIQTSSSSSKAKASSPTATS